MPRWTFNPAEAQAGFPVYDPGIYEFRVESVTPFANPEKDGVQAGGVRVKLSIQASPDGKNVGKPFMNNCYIHTEAAWGFVKGFIMAVEGYATKQQDEYNAWSAQHSYEVDVENQALGDGWTRLVGRNVKGNVSVKANPETGEPQNNARWMPV